MEVGTSTERLTRVGKSQTWPWCVLAGSLYGFTSNRAQLDPQRPSLKDKPEDKTEAGEAGNSLKEKGRSCTEHTQVFLSGMGTARGVTSWLLRKEKPTTESMFSLHPVPNRKISLLCFVLLIYLFSCAES